MTGWQGAERHMLRADTINAIMGAFGNGFTAFVFPAAYHMWVYRKAEARAALPEAPAQVSILCSCDLVAMSSLW